MEQSIFKNKKVYPCPLSEKGCIYAGNKTYNYGFCNGTASYCFLKDKFISKLKECPKDGQNG